MDCKLVVGGPQPLDSSGTSSKPLGARLGERSDSSRDMSKSFQNVRGKRLQNPVGAKRRSQKGLDPIDVDSSSS